MKFDTQHERSAYIEKHLKLAYSRVSIFNFGKMDEDIAQVAVIGLIKAVDAYDEDKGVKFCSFAVRCIDNEILMMIRKIKRHNFSSVLRLNYPISHEEEFTLEETLTDDKDFTEDSLKKIELDIFIKSNLDNLSDREIEALLLLSRGKSQVETARVLGCSRTAISRMMKKVKEMAARMKI